MPKLERGNVAPSPPQVDALLLVARLFLAMPFVIFGIMKYVNMGKMQAYIETAGLPGQLIWLVIPWQVVCGLAVATGYYARTAALLLGAFCLIATSIYHTSWSVSGELSAFTKDFATTGGFILLWLCGPGRFSLDYRLRRAGQGALAPGSVTPRAS